MFTSKLARRRTMQTVFASSLLAISLHEASPIVETPPSDAIHPKQKYAKTWTVNADDAKKLPTKIDRLRISVPGLTNVSFRPNEASVKASSETPDVLDAIEVVPYGSTGIEIRAKHNVSRQYLLTEVSLPIEMALKTLECVGSGTTVIEDRVLVTNAPDTDVSIKLTGSGDVYVTSHSDVRVNAMDLTLSGSGDLQIVAPSVTTVNAFSSKVTSSGDIRAYIGAIKAGDIRLSTTGSGDLRVAALSMEAKRSFGADLVGSGSIKTLGDVLKANRIAFSVSGSGDLWLTAKDAFEADEVQGSVAGSGDVQLASHSSHCQIAHLSVAGSGTLDARDLVARTATTQVTGSGDIVVRVSDDMQSEVTGSGGVTLVGGAPQRVMGKARIVAEKPSYVEKAMKKAMRPTPVPTPSDAFDGVLNGTINVASLSDAWRAIKTLWNYDKYGSIRIVGGSDAETDGDVENDGEAPATRP